MNRRLFRIGLVSVCLLVLLFNPAPFSSISSTKASSLHTNSDTSNLFSSADGGTNITELGCCTVHGYDSQNSFSYYNQSNPDSDGNYAFATVTAFALNPLQNSDPNYDYYIFDIYASVTSASYSNWWVDSAGVNDPNGAALTMYAESCLSANQSIYLPYFYPSSYIADYSSSAQQTTSLNIGYGGFSFGYSHTFTVPTTETEPTNQASCLVSWKSGPHTNANPRIASYQYDFAVGVKVPKGQPATIAVFVEGNFYQPYDLGLLYHSDTTYLYFPITFNTPPVTTITSSPAGLGYVYVDGAQVTTPAKYVWDEGNIHTITASQYVPSGLGIRYSFASWSDGGLQSHDIMAPSVPTNFTANFQQQDELNISSSAGGTTDPPPNSYWYNNTQVAVVKTLPQTGYALENWVLDGVDQGNASQISISMSKPHSLTEVFVPVPTITVNAGIGGTVVVQSSAIDNGVPQLIPSGEGVTYGVPSGSNITMTEKPSADYSFVQFTGSQSSQSTEFSVIVQGNMQESAVFAQNTSTITTTTSSTSSSATSTSSSQSSSSGSSTSIPQAGLPATTTSSSGSQSSESLPSISPTLFVAAITVAVVVVAAIVASLFLRKRS